MKPANTRLSLTQLEQGIRAGDAVILAKALTLVESTLRADQKKGQQLLMRLMPAGAGSIRIGITGIPGVGKSTFIEAFGKYLTSTGKRVAVLAIDPTSQKTRGSILGDKTRMEALSRDPLAFIRPTASGHTAGGIAAKTFESIALCEAAGFDVILVETVGVGQSEVAVRGLVDFFLLLMLPGAGDDLQGIKKGIMEMADGIVITKADGDNLKRAKQAQADLNHALHLFQTGESGWRPKVIMTSAVEKTGVAETWQMVENFLHDTRANGFFASNRNHQKLEWFRRALAQRTHEEILSTARIRSAIKKAEERILKNEVFPGQAAEEIIQTFLKV